MTERVYSEAEEERAYIQIRLQEIVDGDPHSALLKSEAELALRVILRLSERPESLR